MADNVLGKQMGKDPGLSALKGPSAPEVTKVLDVKLPAAGPIASLEGTSFSTKMPRPAALVTPLAGQIEKKVSLRTQVAPSLGATPSQLKTVSAHAVRNPFSRFRTMATRIGRWLADFIRGIVMRLLRLTGNRNITVVAPSTHMTEKKAETEIARRPEGVTVHRQ